jgi:hypothetical protein
VRAAVANMNPTDAAHAAILNGVRSNLGRNVDFASQRDGEAIENAAIHLDPTYHPVLAVAKPCYSEASPTNAMLAHELGHAMQSAFLGRFAELG